MKPIGKFKGLGYYVVKTVSKTEYTNKMEYYTSNYSPTYANGKSTEELVKKNEHLFDKTFFIYRRKLNITSSSKEFIVNSIVGDLLKFVPDSLLKEVFNETQAREKFPEFFL